jgi:hypothetical protein
VAHTIEDILARERRLTDHTGELVRQALVGFGVPATEARALVAHILTAQVEAEAAEQEDKK